MKSLCFILMPLGCKPAGDSQLVDFDAVYEQLVRPAVVAAGLEPLRADEEPVRGLIPQAMLDRLFLCEFAIADVTSAAPDVFYQLGLRQGIRSRSTQLLVAEGQGLLPFDETLLGALPYRLAADGTPADPAADSAALCTRLLAACQAPPESPLSEIVESFPDIQRLKTDVFRDHVTYAENLKSALAAARHSGEAAVAAIESGLGDIERADAAVVVDLFLSYRALKAWQRMVDLVPRMAPPLAATVMVREQLALALNRAGRWEEAEQILLELIRERGASSETCGILGRVYKDRWQAATKAGETVLARDLLDKAIDAYLKGFEADWRDAYPGINAVTLMELKGTPDPRQGALLPVVTYAVERRIVQGTPDYWDYATRLELAVLGRDQASAEAHLAEALIHVREKWEAESTAENLRLIREAREQRGEAAPWLQECERLLLAVGQS